MTYFLFERNEYEESSRKQQQFVMQNKDKKHCCIADETLVRFFF